MDKTFSCNQHELAQAKITFWFYVVSIPIIVFLLFILPILRGIAYSFSVFQLFYVALILILLFLTYRSYRVMHAIQISRCTISDDTITGVSTPDPFKKTENFSIKRSDVLGVAKKQVNISMTRYFNAVVLNTHDKQYVLFAIDRADELIEELQ